MSEELFEKEWLFAEKILLDKAKLEQENKQLKENLRVSQSNEETYCLEMQEITKILGLDEHTLFDDVKDYAKQLKENKKELIEFLKEYDKYRDTFKWNEQDYIDTIEKIKELLGDKDNEI